MLACVARIRRYPTLYCCLLPICSHTIPFPSHPRSVPANSVQTEARLEKEAVEERLRAAESKLTVARRERNALLAAVRDIQRRGRMDLDPLSALTPSELCISRGGGETRDFGAGDGGSSRTCEGGEATGGRMTDGQILAGGKKNDVGVVEVVEDRTSEKLPRGTVEKVDASGLGSGGEGGSGGVGEGGVAEVGERGTRGGRTASLSARLEVLAAQTRQLLADGSDSSYSDDDDSDSE